MRPAFFFEYAGIQDGTYCACGNAYGESFASAQLVRARRLLSFEREFDADPELVAMTVEYARQGGHSTLARRRQRGAGFSYAGDGVISRSSG